MLPAQQQRRGAMSGAKEIDHFDSAVGWSLVREDCALGLDALVAAHDTLRCEGADEAAQVRWRIGVMDRLSRAIQSAALALEDIRTAETLPQTADRRAAAAQEAYQFGLTHFDVAILQGAAEGQVDKAIAQALKASPEHIHSRWRGIRARLRAHDRSNAVGIALALGLIRPPAQAARLLYCMQARGDVN